MLLRDDLLVGDVYTGVEVEYVYDDGGVRNDFFFFFGGGGELEKLEG